MLGGTRKLSRRRLCTDGFKHVSFQILNAHVFFLKTQLPDKVLGGGWMPPGWIEMPPGWVEMPPGWMEMPTGWRHHVLYLPFLPCYKRMVYLSPYLKVCEC